MGRRGAAGNPREMAEVYQAAYAAAFYAQQQQLQQLLRMQAQAAQGARGAGGVGLDQAALAAAAAGLLGNVGYGGAFGGASNGFHGGKGSYGGGGYGGYGGGHRDDAHRGGNRGVGKNARGRGGGRGGPDGFGGRDGGVHRVGSSGGLDRGGGHGLGGGGLGVGVDSAAEAAEMDARFGSVQECLGTIATLARDQHGCRFLQRRFDEDGADAVDACFPEILAEAVELMMDPFGNYLVQKLLECCSDEQRVAVLEAVAKTADGEEDKDKLDDKDDSLKTKSTSPPFLVTVALNTHGTRAVQKLVETLRGPEQIALAVAALKPGVVTLIKDLNGNHVVQRCLQRLSSDENQFVYDAAERHCVEIATHRHGCCVLQRCVDHADATQRRALVEAIAGSSLALAQDPFGNYVVQYVLDLDLPWCNAQVMARLAGTYAELSTQKFSSNVVEKCLKRSADRFELETHRDAVVREIMNSPLLDRLLMDPYGNYVVQSSLSVTHGALRNELVERIKPHLPLIKNSPFGKRILRLLLEHKK
jgi:pumilio RNA-binding family